MTKPINDERKQLLLSIVRKRNFSFKFIDNFDDETQKLINYINPIVDTIEWTKNTLVPGGTLKFIIHNEIEQYEIYSTRNKEQWENPYEISLVTEDEQLVKLVDPIIKSLEKTFKGRVLGCSLNKLPAKTIQSSHTDHFVYMESISQLSKYFQVIRRVLIPLITNDMVFFRVDSEYKTLNIGEAWEINNNHPHDVSNMGDTDRIYLSLDILTDDYPL